MVGLHLPHQVAADGTDHILLSPSPLGQPDFAHARRVQTAHARKRENSQDHAVRCMRSQGISHAGAYLGAPRVRGILQCTSIAGPPLALSRPLHERGKRIPEVGWETASYVCSQGMGQTGAYLVAPWIASPPLALSR